MDAAAPDARRARPRRGDVSRADRRQCGRLGASAGRAPFAISPRWPARRTDELRPIIDAFRAPGVSFLTPYAPAPLNEKTVDRHQPRGADPLLASHRVAEGRLAETGIRRRPRLALAARARPQPSRRDQDRVLSAAATEDRSKLFAARSEAWSRRYGGGLAAGRESARGEPKGSGERASVVGDRGGCARCTAPSVR